MTEELDIQLVEELDVQPVEELDIQLVEELDVQPVGKLDVQPVEELDVQLVEELDIQPVGESDVQPVDDTPPDFNAMSMEEKVQQYGAWKSAPPPSKWDDFKYWFRTKFTPFVGPSEDQLMREGTWKHDPITGEETVEFKPNAPKILRQGIFNTALVDNLGEDFGLKSKDLQTLGLPEEWAKGIAGTQRGYLEGMEQLTNPILAAAAAVTSISTLAGRALSAGFGVHMASSIPDIYETFDQAVEAGDTETAAEALTGFGLTALFAAKATQHAFGKNLTIQSPTARRLLSNRITTEYTGPQLRAIYNRVNRGEGTPAEAEMVRFVNGEMQSPGQLLKKGATTKLTKTTSKIQNNFFKRYMGLEDVKVPIARRQIAEKAGTKGSVEAPEAVGKYMKSEGIPIPMSVETVMGIPKGAKTTVIPPKVEEVDFFGKTIGKAKDVYRKWFTSKGRLQFTDPTSGLTVNVHGGKNRMEGRTLAELKKLDHISAGLRRAEKSSYSKNNPAPENLHEMMNDFLAGNKVELPKPIVKQLSKMRVHRKKLSKELQGLVTGELKTTIGDNMDVYLHRSYEIFDNPGFQKILLKGKGFEGSTYEVAKNFLAKHRRADLEAEAIKAGIEKPNEINNFVDRRLAGEMNAMLDVQGRDIFDGLATSKRITDIIKKRGDIPKELRDVMGEYKNPYLNYARTVSKMADFVQKTKFYNQLRDAGLNRFLFEKKFEGFETKIGGGERFSVKPDGTQGKKILTNSRLGAIDGLYTTKEFAEVLSTLDALPQPSGLQKFIMVPTGAANITATVLSHVTQFRNVYGAGVMGMANNRLSVKESAKAMQNIYRDLAKKTTIQQRKALENYAELGLFDQSVVATEMLASMKDIIGSRRSQVLEDLSAGRITKSGLNKLVRAGKLPFEIYQGVDAGMRIANFEVELARYSKALKISPKDPQLRQRVGDIIKDTYPTYSQVPRSVQMLRRFPPIGQFVSFPAEVVRTTKNTYKIAIEELKTPELREIGAKRMAAMTGTLLLPEAVRMTMNTMNGVSEEEESALRRFVPHWSANGNLQMSKDKEGHWNYIDLKYSDPYSYLKEPLVAALRSKEEPDVHFDQALGTLIAPFTDEKIFFKYANEAWNNETESGRKIFEEVDSRIVQEQKRLSHMMQAITPGSVKSVNRLYKAAKGEKGDFGKEYDLSNEAFAQLGFRTSKLDIQKSLAIYKLPKAKSELNSYSATFSREINRQELTLEQQKELYQKTNNNRFKKWQSIYQDLEAARTLGVSMVGVELALRENGFNKNEREAFRNGTFIPYKPSEQKVLEIQTSGINSNFNFLNLFDVYSDMFGIPLTSDE